MQTKRQMRTLKLLVLALLLFPAVGTAFPAAADESTPAADEPAGIKVESGTASAGAAASVQVATTEEPPPAPDTSDPPLMAEPTLPEGDAAIDSDKTPEIPETVPQGASIAAANDFTFFRNAAVTVPGTSTSTTEEPSIAQVGNTAFMTGNWWAARSLNGGRTFDYVNPYTAFPASFGGFCCDQTTIYDPHYNITI